MATAKHEDLSVDVPITLSEAPPPRLLGLWDQTALWGNLGVSLLLLVSATFVLAPDPGLPPLSLAAALTAIVVGALIGNALLGLAAVPGAQTGAPAWSCCAGCSAGAARGCPPRSTSCRTSAGPPSRS